MSSCYESHASVATSRDSTTSAATAAVEDAAAAAVEDAAN